MASVESVKEKLNGLIDSANAVTGKKDGDLTAAVGSLMEGFGQSEDKLAARLDGSLTEYSNSQITTLTDYAFYGCGNLKRVSLPNLTRIGKYSFNGCPLEEFDFSNINVGGGYSSSFAFSGAVFTHIVLPKMTILPWNIFERCLSLEVVDCHVVSIIQGQAFRYDTNLKTLILRQTSGPVEIGHNIFSDVGLGVDSKVCAVYVPAALIEQYQTATNWSGLYEGGAVVFHAIEGSEFE